jgi:hypothetical protein
MRREANEPRELADKDNDNETEQLPRLLPESWQRPGR